MGGVCRHASVSENEYHKEESNELHKTGPSGAEGLIKPSHPSHPLIMPLIINPRGGMTKFGCWGPLGAALGPH